MVKLRLVPYKLKIKNLEKSKKGKPAFEDLEKTEFKKYFQEFIEDHKALEIDVSKERIFNCESCKHDTQNDIFYGNLGYRASYGSSWSLSFFSGNYRRVFSSTCS